MAGAARGTSRLVDRRGLWDGVWLVDGAVRGTERDDIDWVRNRMNEMPHYGIIAKVHMTYLTAYA